MSKDNPMLVCIEHTTDIRANLAFVFAVKASTIVAGTSSMLLNGPVCLFRHALSVLGS